jgi:hypothetical protein
MEWTCAWVPTGERERQGEEVLVLRQTAALPLPSSPTMEAPYTDSSIFRTCLHSLVFVQIKRCDSTGAPAFVKLAKRSRAFRIFAASARRRVCRQHHFYQALRLVERLHITSARARYPQLRGVIVGRFTISYSSPSNGGVTPLFPAAMLFRPLADHREFRCCNVWSTSDLSCGHLSKNRVNGAPAFDAPTASR